MSLLERLLGLVLGKEGLEFSSKASLRLVRVVSLRQGVRSGVRMLLGVHKLKLSRALRLELLSCMGMG